MNNSISFAQLPKIRWHLHMAPGVVIHMEKAPNPIHRLMQRLVFGFRYVRIDRGLK